MYLVEKDRDEEQRPDQPLLTVKEVAALLKVPLKKVYALPIPRVTLSERRVRFLDGDVRAFIRRRRTA